VTAYKINLNDKYVMALVIICDLEGDLTVEICNEIIEDMVMAGELQKNIAIKLPKSKGIH
jgi:hypothetical protein